MRLIFESCVWIGLLVAADRVAVDLPGVHRAGRYDTGAHEAEDAARHRPYGIAQPPEPLGRLIVDLVADRGIGARRRNWRRGPQAGQQGCQNVRQHGLVAAPLAPTRMPHARHAQARAMRPPDRVSSVRAGVPRKNMLHPRGGGPSQGGEPVEAGQRVHRSPWRRPRSRLVPMVVPPWGAGLRHRERREPGGSSASGGSECPAMECRLSVPTAAHSDASRNPSSR